MKYVLIIAFFVPFAADAQRNSIHARSQSVNGVIQMPILMNIEVANITAQEVSLVNFEEFALGKIYNNYFNVNVKANKPWIVLVMAENRFFYPSSVNGSLDMPVNLLHIKNSNDNRFINVTNAPQTLFRSTNNNISNHYNVDLKIDAPFNYRSSNYWTNLVFTVTSQ